MPQSARLGGRRCGSPETGNVICGARVPRAGRDTSLTSRNRGLNGIMQRLDVWTPRQRTLKEIEVADNDTKLRTHDGLEALGKLVSPEPQ